MEERQGAHHVAQKSTKTAWPRKSESDTLRPPRSSRLKRGAVFVEAMIGGAGETRALPSVSVDVGAAGFSGVEPMSCSVKARTGASLLLRLALSSFATSASDCASSNAGSRHRRAPARTCFMFKELRFQWDLRISLTCAGWRFNPHPNRTRGGIAHERGGKNSRPTAESLSR